MVKSTKPLSKRIAVVFDFDDTLVPDTVDSLASSCGFDSKAFRLERIQPLIESGWDAIPARFYSFIQESQQRADSKDKITQEYLTKFGQELAPNDCVTEMFDRLRQRAHELNPKVEVEFYLITCGMVEIARHTCIAHNFKSMWGCEFHYNENGEIEFLKRIVTHTEKTRYLFEIAKGIDNNNEDSRSFVYRDVPPEELHVPLTQDMSASQRVVNLAEADYSEDSELMRSLTLAVESMCKQIALSQLGVGE